MSWDFKIFLSNNKILNWCTQWEKKREWQQWNLYTVSKVYNYNYAVNAWLDLICYQIDVKHIILLQMSNTVYSVTQLQIYWSQTYEYLLVSYSYYSKKNNAPRPLVSEKNTAPRTKHRARCPIKMKHRATYGHLARCLVQGAVFFSDTKARGAVMRGWLIGTRRGVLFWHKGIWRGALFWH